MRWKSLYQYSMAKRSRSSKKLSTTITAARSAQIIYYVYLEDVAFFYFRFNFKMTGAGWMLSNFTFKSETEELFPKDFVTR